MINNQDSKKPVPPPNPGYTDPAKVDVECHILIKDKDTNKVLVNTRG